MQKQCPVSTLRRSAAHSKPSLLSALLFACDGCVASCLRTAASKKVLAWFRPRCLDTWNWNHEKNDVCPPPFRVQNLDLQAYPMPRLRPGSTASSAHQRAQAMAGARQPEGRVGDPSTPRGLWPILLLLHCAPPSRFEACYLAPSGYFRPCLVAAAGRGQPWSIALMPSAAVAGSH